MTSCGHPQAGFIVIGRRVHLACTCDDNYKPGGILPHSWRKFANPYFWYYERSLEWGD